MERERRQIENKINPDADDLLQLIEATTAPETGDIEADAAIEILGEISEKTEGFEREQVTYDFAMHGFHGSTSSTVVLEGDEVDLFTLRLPIPPDDVEGDVTERLEEAVVASSPPYEAGALRTFVGSGFTPHVTNLYGEADLPTFVRWVQRLVRELEARVGFHPRFSVHTDVDADVPTGRETGLAQMGCGELKERMLDLADAARQFPVDAVVSARLREEWRRAGARLTFAARENDCIQQGQLSTLRSGRDRVALQLGEMGEMFDAIENFERAVRRAFEGSVAGMSPG